MVPLTTKIELQPSDPGRLAALLGPLDQNLKHLERRLGVHVRNRGNVFQISGPGHSVKVASVLLSQLYRETAQLDSIEPELVHLFLQQSGVDAILDEFREDNSNNSGPTIVTRKKVITPRGSNQIRYISNIEKNDVNFGIGPAGTGKSYLAVGCAVAALHSGRVNKIVLVRPAVEAGEKLGFLPGDLSQKIDPYLRPLYDALYETMGYESVTKSIERNIIEVAPLAYMRGRTINNAFIILDESQNTTIAQMKMFLTRIGFGSTAVITGDITQVDLPSGQKSGLVNAIEVLRHIVGITFTHFSSKDVVRHSLVQEIVEAYEAQVKPSVSDRDVS